VFAERTARRAAVLAVLVAGSVSLALNASRHPAASAAASDDAVVRPETLTRIRADLERRRLAEHTPGITIALRREGRSEIFALGDSAPGTVYAIGSLTKTFVGAAVLRLAARGEVDLGAPLARYVPEYRRSAGALVDDALRNCSGVPNYLTLPAVADAIARGERGVDPLAALNAAPLAFPPGTHWQYSNGNYYLLGRLVARVARQPYAQALGELVVRPLGLEATYFDAGAVPAHLRATGWTWTAGRQQRAVALPAQTLRGAADAWSDAADVARWTEGFFGEAVVPPAVRERALRERRLGTGERDLYDAGWFRADCEGHPCWFGEGRVPGFAAAAVEVPDQHFSVAVLTESDAAQPKEAALRIVDLALERSPAPAARTDVPLAIQRRAREWIGRIADGRVERGQLTDDLAGALNPLTVHLIGLQLAALGSPTALTPLSRHADGEETIYRFRITFAHGTSTFVFGVLRSGKIATLEFLG
jgi:CubicO group peptidase (beta-lactamase class C family)